MNAMAVSFVDDVIATSDIFAAAEVSLRTISLCFLVAVLDENVLDEVISGLTTIVRCPIASHILVFLIN